MFLQLLRHCRSCSVHLTDDVGISPPLTLQAGPRGLCQDETFRKEMAQLTAAEYPLQRHEAESPPFHNLHRTKRTV